MNREKIIKQRVILPTDFLGKRYTPSLSIGESFLKVFSLVYPNLEKIFSLKKLIFEQDRFILTLVDKGNQECFDIIIQDNAGIKKCEGAFCTHHLCFGIHEKPQNKYLLAFLLYLSKKGDFIHFDTLLKILAQDYKAKKEYYQLFWKGKRPPFSIIQDWAHPTHAIRCIVPEGVVRNMDQSLELKLSEAYIHHSERECRSIGPELDQDKCKHFFSYSSEFYDHRFDKYFYLPEDEKQIMKAKKQQGISVFTDLDEDDIIMGKGNKKLEEEIEKIIQNIDNFGVQALSFNCCCVPRIVGDDIVSILEKTKKKISIPFIFSGQFEKTPFEQKIVLLEKYLSAIETKTILKEEKTFSLFGYHENQYLGYMYDICKRNGITLKAMFIPTIDIDLLKKLYESELFVFLKNDFLEEVFEYPFKSMGVKYISPKSPYGIKNTHQWFQELFSFFGQEFHLGELEQKIVNEYGQLVSYVSEKKYRIGFIFLGKSQLDIFFNTCFTNNVDVIEFVEEMGFGIDFFVYDNFDEYLTVNNEIKFTSADGDHSGIESLIYSKLVYKEKHTIIFLGSEEEMYEKIKEAGTHLIYSDIFYEDRFYGLGLNICNIRAFYSGYQGARDTITFLLKLIEIHYFKNFGKYFH